MWCEQKHAPLPGSDVRLLKLVCPLITLHSAGASNLGEHGRKGAFIAFGNTESFYRNMVCSHGPYCEEGEGGGVRGYGGCRGGR